MEAESRSEIPFTPRHNAVLQKILIFKYILITECVVSPYCLTMPISVMTGGLHFMKCCVLATNMFMKQMRRFIFKRCQAGVTHADCNVHKIMDLIC